MLHSPRYHKTRIVLLIVIIVVFLSVIGWFVYEHYAHRPLTEAQIKVLTIDEVKNSSPLVPASVKAPVLEQMAKDNTPPAKPDKTGMGQPQFTEAQREAAISSIVSH